jgi:hypothetical protein
MAEDYPKGNSDVSITFRVSARAYLELNQELELCGCNMSSFVRQAVMQEIHDRRLRRKEARPSQVLDGQTELERAGNAE